MRAIVSLVVDDNQKLFMRPKDSKCKNVCEVVSRPHDFTISKTRKIAQ